MSKPRLYTLPNCPGCVTVKRALAAKNAMGRVELRDASQDVFARELNALGSRSVPALAVPNGAGFRLVTDPGAILRELGV